jgi:hypothetical protein
MDITLAILSFFIRGSFNKHFIIFKSVWDKVVTFDIKSPVNILYNTAGLMAADNSDSSLSTFSLKTIPKTEIPPKQSIWEYTFPRALSFSMINCGFIL